MPNMKKIAVSLAGAACVALAGHAWPQQAAKGAKKAEAKKVEARGEAQAAEQKISMCVGCHGIPMYKSVFPEVYNVPKIAGQSPQYIQAALRAYRSGERNHPSMTGVAKGLSDQDILDVAAYYGAEAKAAGAAK
jgi:cytochrome c553